MDKPTSTSMGDIELDRVQIASHGIHVMGVCGVLYVPVLVCLHLNRSSKRSDDVLQDMSMWQHIRSCKLNWCDKRTDKPKRYRFVQICSKVIMRSLRRKRSTSEINNYQALWMCHTREYSMMLTQRTPVGTAADVLQNAVHDANRLYQKMRYT